MSKRRRHRTRWVNVHGDETYFRDTAHGFLAWAVATLLTAAVLTSAIGTILGTGARAAGSVAETAATEQDEGLEYWVDSLFRRAPPPSVETDPDASPSALIEATAMHMRHGPPAEHDTRQEAGRILAHALAGDALDPEDNLYIAQLVAQHTEMSTSEAQARVSDIEARLRTSLEEAEIAAREAADEAREASAYAALWLFITLLIGAFTASLLATFGGRQRDA